MDINWKEVDYFLHKKNEEVLMKTKMFQDEDSVDIIKNLLTIYIDTLKEEFNGSGVKSSDDKKRFLMYLNVLEKGIYPFLNYIKSYSEYGIDKSKMLCILDGYIKGLNEKYEKGL